MRRSLSEDAEVKYHRSNALAEVPLEKLAQVRGSHWSVEQSFQAAKGECGLDEDETRGWVGWHLGCSPFLGPPEMGLRPLHGSDIKNVFLDG